MGSHGGDQDPEASRLARKETFEKLVARASKLSDDRLEAMRERISETLPLDDQLRFAIAMSGKTQYALAKQIGVVNRVISRFMNYERDIRMETAAKLAEALGLSLQKRG